MATTTLTGSILTGEGAPWPSFAVKFTLTPSAAVGGATLPYQTVTATTDEAGEFSIDLVSGVTYLVGLDTAFLRAGSSTRYPPGTQFTVYVPESATPIRLEALQAMSSIPSPVPSAAQTAIDAAVAPYVATVSALETIATRVDSVAYDVRKYGAVGDGATAYAAETAAFQAALMAAGGGWVVVPAGTYLIGQIDVSGVCRMRLEAGARLLLRPGTHTTSMFAFSSGAELTIRGLGMIDGNRANITGRPALITGTCEAGSIIDIEGVHLTSFVMGARLTQFGGYLNFSRNRVADQAQHSGTTGEFSSVVTIVNGQEDAEGLIVTDGNWHVFDDTLLAEGSNPGGYFVCTSPDIGGGATPYGNMTTWRADGNHFYGYGQFGGPGTGTNDISPLHTYPTIAGARWTNNHFEGCGFCAMSAKSVVDFVCTGNVIRDGLRSSRNVASEGAISYVPGYQAGSETRARAVIANNIIDTPGGEATMGQTGIAVKGTSTSKATDVVVANNVYTGDGLGVDIVNAEDVVLSGNILRVIAGVSDTDAGIGVRLSNVEGRVIIAGGSIECANGNGIVAITGNATANITVIGVEMIDLRETGANILCRDCASLKVSGTTFRRPEAAGQALNIGGTIGLYSYDESNTIVDGEISIAWTSIATASGHLVDAGSPVSVVTPAHAGVLYRQTDGDGALYVAVGTTSADWAVLPAATTASIVYGTNSAGGALNRRAASGERVAGQVPVYGSAGDLVVANTPGTTASATSRAYVDAAVAVGSAEAQVTGLLGWAYDPVTATSVLAMPVAGVLATVDLRIGTAGALRRIWWQTASAGSGLTNCWIGLYTAAGVLIEAIDTGSQFATSGNKSLALAADYAATAGQILTIAILWNGSSGPSLRGHSGTGIVTIGGVSRWRTGGSGLTTLPSTLPSLTAVTTPWWVGAGVL